jgi:hypothetical protein
MPGIEKKGRSKIASYKKGSGPCWSGYEMIGMKSKGGKKVPNCVPKKASKGMMVRGGGAAIKGLKFEGVK